MKIKKLTLAGLFLSAIISLAGCGTKESVLPVSLTWEMGATGVEPGYYENSFVLKNISRSPLKGNWTIYYSQLPRDIKQEGTPAVKVEPVNGNFYKMSPTDSYTPLAPGDSLRVTFRCTFKVERSSQVPEGAYWVETVGGKEQKPLPIALRAMPLPHPESLKGYPDATRIYASNRLLEGAPALRQADILPSVKRVELTGADSVLLDGCYAIKYPKAFDNEATWLQMMLAFRHIFPEKNAATTIVLDSLADAREAVNDEYYTLAIGDSCVKIAAATSHGIFNGVQTFLDIVKGKEPSCKLEGMKIQDYPDLPYRGLMLDVARDFTQVGELEFLLDYLSEYKINVLHLHFCDDEGWRLEIPGLEELTSVGSRRGHTTDESQCLYPCYEGSCDPDQPSPSSGHYTRKEFIDFLKHATSRHIRVIPEIESPGHARAAVVSMKARYNRYKDTDPQKAAEYLLSEPEDTSRYSSVQYYTDNVMNVALPSTYRFIEKVVRELVEMYREAGAPLTTIHVGGDEVPDGVWMGSPACRKLMAEKGLTGKHDLSEHFLMQLADIMQRNGLQLGGWQEIAQGHTEEGHARMRRQASGVYCWSTGPGSDEVVYQTANNGYPVILCNVGNFYMDMAYSGHPDEPGLDWGGYVDEATSFSMLPYNIYRSLRTDRAGRPLNLTDAGKGKTALTAEGKRNIVGVQGQLFSETIRNFAGVEYQLFPKILGLAERGWNAHPAWESLSGEREQQAYLQDLKLYYAKISLKEMPCWAKYKRNFRLPHPGLELKEGMLYANVSILGAEVRYTTDGTEPTVQSPLWEAPVACAASVIKAKTFYRGKESVSITLRK